MGARSEHDVRQYWPVPDLRLDDGAGHHTASLNVDGRAFEARPLRGSALGQATGLAVVAPTERDVLEAVAQLPGRVLILCSEAITRQTVPVVVNSAHLETFVAIVVVTDDPADLGRIAVSGVPIPIVVVSREVDREWLRRAVRVTVGVRADGQAEVDVRSHRPERRRRVPSSSSLGAPGTVRT